MTKASRLKKENVQNVADMGENVYLGNGEKSLGAAERTE